MSADCAWIWTFGKYISLSEPLNDNIVTFRPQEWISEAQMDGIRYIERVYGSFGSNVMALIFSVAALLEICKLGAFHPREIRGTF